ncbi:MAG: aspartate aminotransferase family protein [Proteobacteria bacterium]|nr:aspartate aminotransferase family protein [Pseudomonadota bacterium]
MTDSVQILELNAFHSASAPTDPSSHLSRRLKNFGAASVLFYREPIEMVSASGSWIMAADGRRYLDFYNNVPSVGHCHPRIVAAVASQMSKININTRYLCAVVDDYLDRLKNTLPRSLSNVIMTCSGSEANDLALRIAAKASGGTGFVVTENAYHGNTRYVTEISPAAQKTAVRPNCVATIPAPSEGGSVGEEFAKNLRTAIRMLESRQQKFAGFICDSIFSSDGIFSDPAGFLKLAVTETRKAEGVFIADEVQPGFARSGESFWGFERHGITPDIVTMGKPMGNGFPMAAMATRPDLLERFCEDIGYFNTFGGNPVAAAAGLAVLDVIEEEGLQQNALRIGKYLKERLAEAARSRVLIGAVRGAGLFLGVDICRDGKPDAATTSNVINRLRDNGILVGAAGRTASTLKLRPPLCLTTTEADIFVDALDDALSS